MIEKIAVSTINLNGPELDEQEFEMLVQEIDGAINFAGHRINRYRENKLSRLVEFCNTSLWWF